jgi:two-component system, OmpR family, alkaline phosphatase synthesis response regulator PhoP
MSRIKVLMADDEPAILEIMAKKVSNEGFDVVTAQDGEEAWNKIASESPDVILLDLTMPKRDGFEILKQLRKSPPSEKWQPVIIVSARSELQDLQEGFSLEADHYLTKPCSMEDVTKAINLMVKLIPMHKSSSDDQ